MPSQFDKLLDELDACQSVRESPADGRAMVAPLHKSHRTSASGYSGRYLPNGELIEFLRGERRESNRRPHGSLARCVADLEQISKAMTATGGAMRLETRAQGVALLKAKYTEVRDQLGVVARSGQMEAVEVAKRENFLNRIGSRLSSIERAGAA
jgi:hypothetical protein